jgi:hypothetical protein
MKNLIKSISVIALATTLAGCGIKGQYNLGVCGGGIYLGLHATVTSKSLIVTDAQLGPTNQVHRDDPLVFDRVDSKGSGVEVFSNKEFGTITLQKSGEKVTGFIVYSDGGRQKITGDKGDLSQLEQRSDDEVSSCLGAGLDLHLQRGNN